ncbi:MAG: arsenate reductase ArsC [Pirellulaceae bacterium]
MKRALVLCTGNSCRSQMAEALFERLSSGQWKADSAGTNPSGFVHPMAIKAMSQLGADLSTNSSDHVDVYADTAYDLVVTVCDNASETCPVFPGDTDVQHWPFPDPADASGSDEEVFGVFTQVRDDIARRIQSFLDSGN